MLCHRSMWIVVVALWCLANPVKAAVLQGNPSNYTTQLGKLKAGDTLQLASGTYTKDLNIRDLNGTPGAWITIQGPASGAPAVFVARSCCNTVEIFNASYVAIVALTLDGKGTTAAFGVSAKGGSNNRVHHIRIEDCTIKDYNGSQQIVGISTKAPTWGWEIRNNQIIRAGTGLYLGNSNGAEPFFDAVIEGNLVMHPIGYCMQIKHQLSRATIAGMPTGPTRVIIRHNVFIKDDRPSPDGDRPNLLLGGFPPGGTGSQDIYEVYGNFFYHNPRESLLQATGRLSLHDNLFVDVKGTAILLQKHNLDLRLAHVYNNTIHAAGTGIALNATPTEGHQVTGNLIFAGQALKGTITNQKDNITDSVNKAGDYVRNASIALGSLDLYPKAGKCEGAALDLSPFAKDTDGRLDFNGVSKGSLRFRGAYAGSGANPGWKLAAMRKSLQAQPPTEPPPTEPAIEPVAEAPGEPVSEAAKEKQAAEPSFDAGVQETPQEPAAQDATGTEPSVVKEQIAPLDGSQGDVSVGADEQREAGLTEQGAGDTNAPATGCGCDSTGGVGSWMLLVLFGLCLGSRRVTGADGPWS